MNENMEKEDISLEKFDGVRKQRNWATSWHKTGKTRGAAKAVEVNGNKRA